MNTSLRLRLTLLLVFLSLVPVYPLRAAVIYVDAGATGANNGSSWTDAYKYLQDALTAAGSGSEIRVAQGTYKPDVDTAHPGGTGSRIATFQLKNGVSIYGGFPTGCGSRDPNIYVTILSGDISGNNSFHVVIGSGTDSTAVLDGFTITHGYADGSPPNNRGAGMYNSSGSPTLTNCIFYSNGARGYQESRYGAYGGGMYNQGSSPTLTKCTFSQNPIFSQMADGYGAGMYNGGGSSPILTDCIFSGNNVTGDDADGYGGGMCNSNSSPTLTNCIFSGNEATSTINHGYGGGMYNNAGSPTLTNCTFSDNSAGSDYGGCGGGICNVGSSSDITNCTFSGNVATSEGGSLGGGIYNSGGSHTLTNCTFSGNQAEGYTGSGAGGGMYNTGSNPNITNCTFSGNEAWGDYGGYGGGICDYSSSPTLTNCTFSGNSADYGGGLYGSSIVTNCILWGNSAAQISGSATVNFSDVQGGWAGTGNIDADPRFGDADGPDNVFGTADDNLRLWFGSPCIDDGNNNAVPVGVVTDLDGNPRFVDDPCTVDTGNGTPPIVDMGAYEYQPSPPPAQASNPSPANLATDVNIYPILSWTAGAGAVSHDVYFGTANPPPFQINQLGTTYNPGGLQTGTTYYWRIDEKNAGGTAIGIIWMFTTTPPNCIFVNAGATGANNGSSWANAYKYLQNALTAAGLGFEIRVAQGTYRPDMDTNHPAGTNDRNATFQLKNGVALYGGFPTGGGSRDPNTYVTSLSGDIGVADNNSDNSYHVVTGSGTDSTAILDGFTITKGHAGDSGGGMYNDSGSPTLANCTFICNSAISGGTVGRGGGIYNKSSSTTITNCTFSGNSASYAGGGIYNSNGSPSLTNCIFTGNSAIGYNGSGLGGGMFNISSSPTLTNCTFTDNYTISYKGTKINATSDGGGIYNSAGSPTLTDCIFTGNSAQGYGGSDASGGGIYNAAGHPTLNNCIFTGNSAYNSSLTGRGGGMFIGGYSSGGSQVLNNCTFSGNSADYGGGIYSDESRLNITNCSFSGNQANGGQGGGIYNTGSSPTVTNCLLWANTALTGPQIYNSGTNSPVVSFSDVQGGWTGTGNINADPCFVTGPDGDYYLSQIASGQAFDSPCVNAGSDTAANLGMDVFTTRTDGLSDVRIVDMGYHYSHAVLVRSADIDKSGHVDFLDFAILAAEWLQCSDPYDSNCTETGSLAGDIFTDYYVNSYDLEYFVSCWLDCYVANARVPEPADGKVDVNPDIVLNWSAGDGAIYHDVYLGTDAVAVANAGYLSEEFKDTVSETSFNPGILDADTTYYWRIDEVGPACTAKGAVWSFTTWVEVNHNLISWWKFDEGSGTTAYDSEGSNNGTLVNGPIWTTGQIDGALSFDGSDDYVALSSFTVSTNNGTIALWFKTSADFSANYGGQGNLISQNSKYYSYLAVLGNGTVPYGIYGETNTNSDYFVSMAGAAPVGVWNHIAVSFYNKTAKTYLNSVLIQTSPVADSALTLDRIGGRTTEFFNGKIDDVRFYDTALSAEDIEQLYQDGL